MHEESFGTVQMDNLAVSLQRCLTARENLEYLKTLAAIYSGLPERFDATKEVLALDSQGFIE